MAAPEAESRFTIARTVTPLVIICWAIVCICCASPCAFWMSKSTPAALKASESGGRSALSPRGDEVVSGRIPPPLPAAALPPPLLLPLPLLLSSLPPQAARPKTSVAARAVMRVRRRAIDTFRSVVEDVSRAGSCAATGATTSTRRSRYQPVIEHRGDVPRNHAPTLKEPTGTTHLVHDLHSVGRRRRE